MKAQYHLDTGNNPALMEATFRRRPWWHPRLSGEPLNFLWVNYSQSGHFADLLRGGGVPRGINHFLGDSAVLTSKVGMFHSIHSYMSSTKRDPFSVIPQTFDLRLGVFGPEFSRFEKRFRFWEGRCIHCLHTQSEMDADRLSPRDNVAPRPSSREPASSVGLTGTRRVVLSPLRSASASPAPRESSSAGELPCIAGHEHLMARNIWLIKPSDGRGGFNIELFNDLKEVLTFVRDKDFDCNAVIQKYVENPHLYHGRKYDIRAFGLLRAAREGRGLVGYHYRDCYLRTSSTPYDTSNVHDRFAHLTNDAVQKQCLLYGAFESINKVTMPDFLAFLQSDLGEARGRAVYRSIRAQMRDLMKMTFQAVRQRLNKDRLDHCFQLLGYDFLVDADYHVWLIEINTNPSFKYDAQATPFKHLMIPRMLEEAFQLTIDQFFPPSEDGSFDASDVLWEAAPCLQVPGEEPEFDFTENRFERIFAV